MSQPSFFSNTVQPVCLSEKSDLIEIGAKAIVTGWVNEFGSQYWPLIDFVTLLCIHKGPKGFAW